MSEHPLARFIDHDPGPEIRAFREALGRFMMAFADTESKMHLALWAMCGTTTAISRAVFSGVKIDGAISFIRRILEVAELTEEQRQPFEYIFKQLGGINKIRNDLIHHGPGYRGTDEFLISNQLLALTPERRTNLTITARDLHLMSVDLDKINMHLGCQIIFPGHTPSPWQAEVLQAPWLFELPEPSRSQTRSHAKPTKRPRPPKPSDS